MTKDPTVLGMCDGLDNGIGMGDVVVCSADENVAKMVDQAEEASLDIAWREREGLILMLSTKDKTLKAVLSVEEACLLAETLAITARHVAHVLSEGRKGAH